MGGFAVSVCKFFVFLFLEECIHGNVVCGVAMCDKVVAIFNYPFVWVVESDVVEFEGVCTNAFSCGVCLGCLYSGVEIPQGIGWSFFL